MKACRVFGAQRVSCRRASQLQERLPLQLRASGATQGCHRVQMHGQRLGGRLWSSSVASVKPATVRHQTDPPS